MSSSPVKRRPQPVPILLANPIKPRRVRVRIRGVSPLLLDPLPPELKTVMIVRAK